MRFRWRLGTPAHGARRRRRLGRPALLFGPVLGVLLLVLGVDYAATLRTPVAAASPDRVAGVAGVPTADSSRADPATVGERAATREDAALGTPLSHGATSQLFTGGTEARVLPALAPAPDAPSLVAVLAVTGPAPTPTPRPPLDSRAALEDDLRGETRAERAPHRSCSWEPARARARSPARCSSSPTPCSRRRCSSSWASWTGARAPATCGCCPGWVAECLRRRRVDRGCGVHGGAAADGRVRGKEAAYEALPHPAIPDVASVTTPARSSPARRSRSPTARGSCGGAFTTKPGVEPTAGERPALLLWAPPAVLAVATAAVGLASHLLDPRLADDADTLPAVAGVEYGLALWHGLTPAHGLSAVSVTAGLALFAARDRVATVQARVVAPWDADRGYSRLMRGLDAVAVTATGATQRGSLPVYLSTIVFAVLALGGARCCSPPRATSAGRRGTTRCRCSWASSSSVSPWRRRSPPAPDGGSARRGHRLTESACCSPYTARPTSHSPVPGGGLDDRRVHARAAQAARHHRPAPHPHAAAVAAARRRPHGVVITALGAMAVSARRAAPVPETFPAAAYDFGGGANVVDVTLVDIRAWDTMGEIAVLVAAATGVASLVFLRRRRRRRPWRRTAGELAGGRRPHRPGAPRAHARGHHPRDLPHRGGAVGLPALRPPQRP